ncbi:uncharacterized protein LOC133815824 isoform X2 [Humulus lupulus]|uniref:uncharacterized protein LOC133815824 isoform X2 n=1 Tax=Humulus lupulus TaxID=3486 RepID=UPI002B410CA9|nr:uncharacterized protein LOC133815824 isoform X2 [Humulus lupulus]
MANEKEGTDLLGSPTFKVLDNGRFKCVETGHEVLEKDKDYSSSKQFRLGLIDYAVSHNKPPLNVFKQDPLSRSSLLMMLLFQEIKDRKAGSEWDLRAS